MRFGEGVIDFQRLERGSLRFWHRLIWRHSSHRVRSSQKIVSVSQPAVSEGEIRISFYRLLKILEGLLHPLLGSLVPIKPSLEIKLKSFVALGVVFGKPSLFARDFELQFVDNLSRNLALRRQQV